MESVREIGRDRERQRETERGDEDQSEELRELRNMLRVTPVWLMAMHWGESESIHSKCLN